MVHVPFHGNGPAVSATLANTTQVIFCSTVAAGPFVESGELKALAYADDTRGRKMPNLPTFIELGVDFKMGTWFGLLGPGEFAAGAGAGPERGTEAGDRVARRAEAFRWAGRGRHCVLAGRVCAVPEG